MITWEKMPRTWRGKTVYIGQHNKTGLWRAEIRERGLVISGSQCVTIETADNSLRADLEALLISLRGDQCSKAATQR